MKPIENKEYYKLRLISLIDFLINFLLVKIPPYLSYLVIGCFAVTLLISSFIPIYTDEVTEKLLGSRILIDGLNYPDLFPQCDSSHTIPLSWLPGRLIAGGLHIILNTPFLMRLSGVFMFLNWLVMLGWFIKHYQLPEKRWNIILCFLISYCTIGILPLMLVINRVEQPLLFCITFFSITSLIPYKKISRNSVIILGGSFLLIASLFFSSHGKALFFFPLVISSAFFLGRSLHSKILGLILIGSVLFLTVQSLHMWSLQYECKGSPAIHHIVSSYTISPAAIVENPASSFYALCTNLKHSFSYISGIIFKDKYMSSIFIPADGMNIVSSKAITSPTLAISTTNLVILLFFMWLVLLACITMGITFVKFIQLFLRRNPISPAYVISWTVFIGIFATCLFQTQKNLYESSFVLPLLLLYFIIIFPLFRKHESFFSWNLLLLVILSLTSQFFVTKQFSHYFGNYLNHTTQQELATTQLCSQIPYDFPQQRYKVIGAAAKCGLLSDVGYKHLIVDDYTYFTFIKTIAPINILYLIYPWDPDASGNAIINLLHEKKSEGVITQCHFIPEAIRKFSIATDNLCCISEESIKKYKPLK